MGIGDRPSERRDRPTGFIGLHGAAYFGCVDIIVALLEMSKRDVQATDFNGKTAIAWASRRGHEEVGNGTTPIPPNLTNMVKR